MKWSEISVQTTNEAVEPIANILHEAGASGVVIEDSSELIKERERKFGEIYKLDPADFPKEGVLIKAYLVNDRLFTETLERIKQKITELSTFRIDIGKNKVTVSEVDEKDWANAWKKYYHPVKVSNTITVVPTWEQYEPANESEKIIELDPGMAFGTGTHPTTVLSIQALEKVIKDGDEVIDVGTGSGILSIAAAKLGAKQIHAYDLDTVAISAAEQNVKLNRVESRISIQQNNLLENVRETADIVVANILADIIIRLADQATRAVKPNGYFVTSGIIQEKQQDVERALAKAGFLVEEVLQMEDWVTLIARKNNAIVRE